MLDRRQKKGTAIKLSAAFGASKCKIQFTEKIIYRGTLQHRDSHDSVHQKYKSLSISICIKYFHDHVIGSYFNNGLIVQANHFVHCGDLLLFLILHYSKLKKMFQLDWTRHLTKEIVTDSFLMFYRPND